MNNARAIRWVAVRHAPEYIHLVATLARQGGIRLKAWNDSYRVRDARQEGEMVVRVAVHRPPSASAGRSNWARVPARVVQGLGEVGR